MDIEMLRIDFKNGHFGIAVGRFNRHIQLTEPKSRLKIYPIGLSQLRIRFRKAESEYQKKEDPLHGCNGVDGKREKRFKISVRSFSGIMAPEIFKTSYWLDDL